MFKKARSPARLRVEALQRVNAKPLPAFEAEGLLRWRRLGGARSSKAAGDLAPGADTEYVRANGAKSARSVSAKPDKDPSTRLACPPKLQRRLADFFNRTTHGNKGQ